MSIEFIKLLEEAIENLKIKRAQYEVIRSKIHNPGEKFDLQEKIKDCISEIETLQQDIDLERNYAIDKSRIDELNLQINELTRNHQSQIQSLEQNYRQKIKELENKSQTAIETLTRQHQQEKQTLKESSANQINQLTAQIQALQQQLTEKQVIISQQAETIKSLQKQLKEKELQISQSPANIEASPAKLENYTESVAEGVILEMIAIPAGKFMMGSNDGNDDEKPVHEVTLKAFYMSKYPITQAQYQAIMRINPSNFKGKNNPVERVSWYEAQEFCQKLSQQTGKKYQLPSEVQWEYACRAGSTTKYCFGDDENQLGEYAWYSGNSDTQTYPVGYKKANQWGLCDMHGNVWEWCEDDYTDAYHNTPKDGSAYKNENSKYAVLRGGSFGPPNACRSACRLNDNARDGIDLDDGFRVVCVLPRHS